MYDAVDWIMGVECNAILNVVINIRHKFLII